MVKIYEAPRPAGKGKAPSAPPADVRQAPLRVNATIVPTDLIVAEAQNHPAPRGQPDVAWRRAANAIAVRTLLLEEAHRRGLQPAPVEVGRGRFETDDEALIRSLLELAIEVERPGEDALRVEWARDPSRFRAPPLWEVSHILCACDPRDPIPRQAAQARALSLAALAQQNPAAFPDLARDHSDCVSRVSGGALGQLRPGDTVPEFEAVLRDLPEGELTAEPVLTRHGWHVIRMDAVAEGAVLPFEAVRPKLADAMEKVSWTRAARDLVGRLVASAEISGAEICGANIGPAGPQQG